MNLVVSTNLGAVVSLDNNGHSYVVLAPNNEGAFETAREALVCFYRILLNVKGEPDAHDREELKRTLDAVARAINETNKETVQGTKLRLLAENCKKVKCTGCCHLNPPCME